MSGKKNCLALVFELEQSALHQHRIHRIEAGERLVHDDNARVVEQRGNELDLLLHALGKLLGFLRQSIGDLHALGPFDGPLARLFSREPVQLAEEDQLLQNLHFFVEAALLGQVANALQALALERLAEKPDPAGVGKRDAHHHANGTGFARSVRPQQAKHLARVDRQTQVADGNLVLVGLGHSCEFNNWHGYPRRTCSGFGAWSTGERSLEQCSKARSAQTAPWPW